MLSRIAFSPAGRSGTSLPGRVWFRISPARSGLYTNPIVESTVPAE